MADKFDLLVAVCSDAVRAEDQVRESLRAGAEKYLAAIGVILGFHIVEMGELRFSGPAARLGCSIGVVVGLALLFAAFVVALQSMRVREYPTYPATNDLLGISEKDTDDQAKRSVAKTYLDLRDGILEVNEKRASTVSLAGILLTLGFLISVLAQLGLKIQYTG
jgi:hypothetical protein